MKEEPATDHFFKEWRRNLALILKGVERACCCWSISLLRRNTEVYLMKEEPATDHFFEEWRRNLPLIISLKNEGGPCHWSILFGILFDFSVAAADLAAEINLMKEKPTTDTEKPIWWRSNLPPIISDWSISLKFLWRMKEEPATDMKIYLMFLWLLLI